MVMWGCPGHAVGMAAFPSSESNYLFASINIPWLYVV